MMELFEINDSNVDMLLERFDKEVNKEGYIVDKKTKEVVKCRYTNNPLTKSNLGGILPGSDIFIEDSGLAYAGYIMEFLATEDG